MSACRQEHELIKECLLKRCVYWRTVPVRYASNITSCLHFFFSALKYVESCWMMDHGSSSPAPWPSPRSAELRAIKIT